MSYPDTPIQPAGPRAARPPVGRKTQRASGLALRGQILVALVIFTLVLTLFSPSPGVVLASGGALTALLFLLWRPGEPPILVFPFVYQWSVVAVKPYLSAFERVPINELSDFGGDIEKAAYFSFAAILCIAAGIRLALGRPRRNMIVELDQEVRSMSLRQVLLATIGFIGFGIVMNGLAPIIPGLRQVLLVLGSFGMAGVFVLAYWCFKNRRGYLYLVVVMAIQIGIGLTGFFSGFQAPVLLLAMAAISARDRLRIPDILILTVVTSLVILIASFWSAIKQDYRIFLNAGTGDQVVLVSFEDRVDYLTGQVRTFDGERLAKGFDLLLKRHSYIDFLGNTLDYVPYFTPHEKGARLGRTFLHVVTPRVLFPNKPPTDFDSEVTVRYTGISLTIYRGTSISIGYLGELYIDFGIVGALVTCLLAGLGIGFGWRILWDNGRRVSVLLRLGLYAALALSLSQFGFALIKLVGGVLTTAAGVFIMQTFVLPHAQTLLRRSRRRRKPVPASALRG